MTTITLNKGGTAERTAEAESLDIADLWHLSQDSRLGPSERRAVLDVWHLAHDLKQHIIEQAPPTNPETVRRALFQVWGNMTAAERERLNLRDAECWRQQANGNAGSQLKAQRAFDDELSAIVEHMQPYRVDLIANYVRGVSS